MKDKDELLDQYLMQILEKNAKINLTNIATLELGRILHTEDSLTALKELNEAPPGLYADLGSGGGYPGVPLAIYSGRSTVLIDSTQKKMRAVQDVLDGLGLSSQIACYGGRIEDYARKNPESLSAVTARAVSSLSTLLEYASPLLKLHGLFIGFKGDLKEEELEAAKKLEEETGMKLRSERSFLLSDQRTKRTIVTFEKSKKPLRRLPRRNGLAHRRPLVG